MPSHTARQMFPRLRYRRKRPASRHLSVQPVRREAQRLTLITDIIWRVKRTEIPVSVAALKGEASLSLDPGHADGAVHELILWHTLW